MNNAHQTFGNRMQTLESFERLFSIVALAAFFFLSGCTSAWQDSRNLENERRTDPFERGKALLAEGNYDGAILENQKAFAEGTVAPDVALFNMGLISAYSLNPKKDYPRALVSFKTITKDYPQSPLVEQARFWIQVLEEHQKINEEQRKLVEEKRALNREREMLNREREMLSQEREKLKYTDEKSRRVDIEIEKRRRQTLQR